MAIEAPDTQTAPARAHDAGHGPGPLLGGRLALVVMGFGLLVIGFGWYGISGRGAQIDGSTDVRAQLPYLVSGKLNKQVASALGRSEITVKIHRGNVMKKMGAGSLAELVRHAEALGIRSS